MLSGKLQTMLNEQIKNELYSGYLYLAMSAYCETENLPGFAHWMREQAKEEQEHAMRLFDFINDRGGQVVLHAIDQPPVEFGTPLELFQAVYEHEQKVTRLINELYAAAVEENDYASQVMLHWFIDEQVEEEKNAGDVVALLERVGDHVNGLVMADRALGQRSGD
ncbi:MAG: ferritin [Anaerolineales bacterium]